MTIRFDEYVRHDATGLAALVAQGEVSATELVACALARIDAVNPRINAVAVPLGDAARAAATSALGGPLAGVPWVMKDLGHPIAGVPMTFGSRAFRDFVPSASSEHYLRLRDAGLITVATSTTPEFGLTITTESTLFGQTRNPWSLLHSSGGSSGGSSALVAAGVVPAAHATDGGGSIRIPASCCGLFGLKPSRGRVPIGVGRTEGWNGMSVSHAVTRSVRDSALLLDIAHGPQLGARYVAPAPSGRFIDALDRPPQGLRIALPRKTSELLDATCEAALNDAIALLESLGHRVDLVDIDLDNVMPHVVTVIGVQLAVTLRDRGAVLGRVLGADDVEQTTLAWAELGKTLPGTAMADADLAFMVAGIRCAELLQRYDLILSTTLARAPHRLGTLSLAQPITAYQEAISGVSPFTALFNATGQPAMSVPLYWSAENLPVGVHFAARVGEEGLLLALAAQLETARPWFARRPSEAFLSD